MRYLCALALRFAGAGASITYATSLLDSIIARDVPPGLESYITSVLFTGIQDIISYSENETYLDWYRTRIDSIVESDGRIDGWNDTFYSIDNQRIGNNILWWYQRTGEEKFRKAATTVRRKFDRYPRLQDQMFWHRFPDYPHQVWLDGLYMGTPFYSRWTSAFDPHNDTAWDDIALQYDVVNSILRNKTTGLLVHGFDESRKAIWADPVNGASPHVWSRADGWYFMALAEVLEIYPKHLSGYKRLLAFYRNLAAALKEVQDDSGGWWLVMDSPYPSDSRNYIESSATAHFTFAYLRGMRLGLLDKSYLDVAEKAWGALIERFLRRNSDGSTDWLGTVLYGTLDSNATFESYLAAPVVPNDFKGAGPFMQAAVEMACLDLSL